MAFTISLVAAAWSFSLLGSALPDGAAQAGARPSFSCAKASTASERMICRDAELARLDRITSDLFAQTLSLLLNSEQRMHANQTQRAWLTTRNRCSNVQCLRQAYFGRISDLAGELPTGS